MRMRGKKPLFGYKDTWNLDATLNTVIAAGLIKFKEVIQSDNCAGCPGVFVEDESDAAHNKGMKDWYATLDKMIYAFSADEPEIPDDLFVMHSKPCEEEGYSEVNIEITDELAHKRYREEEADHWKKVQEGRILFAKHYDSLWW